jgi:alpha-methylacyl-CoA racemase
LLEILQLTSDALGSQHVPADWPAGRAKLAALFATRSRDEWAATFAGTDACVTPVLSLAEATENAHMQARAVFGEVDGHPCPGPAPRFSRTPGELKNRVR